MEIEPWQAIGTFQCYIVLVDRRVLIVVMRTGGPKENIKFRCKLLKAPERSVLQYTSDIL